VCTCTQHACFVGLFRIRKWLKPESTVGFIFTRQYANQFKKVIPVHKAPIFVWFERSISRQSYPQFYLFIYFFGRSCPQLVVWSKVLAIAPRPDLMLTNLVIFGRELVHIFPF
jgi:hypothetical protein